MKYQVRHVTTYQYSDMVSLCQNEIHLAPRSYSQQTCMRSNVHIVPTPAVIKERRDYFGNHTAFFALQERHDLLRITATSDVEVLPSTTPDVSLTPPWEDVRITLAEDTGRRHLPALQYLHESYYIKMGDEFSEYARPSFPAGRPVLEAMLDLTRRINREFVYDPKATNMSTSVTQVLQLRRGVCQDFAHFQIACLRSLGLAARYVSGYLLTVAPPGKERLRGSDASHAWVSFYCPGFGWIDLDPTNDVIPTDKHVVLAWGRDYGDVCPVKGVILGGGDHTIHVGVDVSPLV
jgi:transglutaminase-like putative cysteine protease